MSAVLRSEAADDDLRRIAYQIGVESMRPSVADRIIDELLDSCDEIARLSDLAQLGTATPELSPGIRLYFHRYWVIIFRYIDAGVLILRIADGGQDYLSWKLS